MTARVDLLFMPDFISIPKGTPVVSIQKGMCDSKVKFQGWDCVFTVLNSNLNW